MSGSVTPARRPRDESDDDEEEEEEVAFDVSVDGESTPPANRNKRARLSEEDDDDEEEEEAEEEEEEEEGEAETEAPLLPDSFRRSPKGKGRAINGSAISDTPKKHQPGSIVRVTLTDFVTYTKAEFNPGPNLNMVIGPNGTGKSTLVCALCIGLGWATKHLGRGKDLDEFVKHGAKSGEIEIELAADPDRHNRNPVITTRIKKGDKANAEYWINGKKENKKRVNELCASFHIQVDNLCQFLPQDRVVEFASLSPVDLLAETQRAAAPEQMTKWHEQLKNYRKDQKQQLAEQQGLTETIKRLQDRHKNQEPDVARLRERVQIQFRYQSLKKMKPLPQYREAKDEWLRSKARRNEAQAELVRLKRRLEPNIAAVNEKQAYVKALQAAVPKKLVTRLEETAAKHKTRINGADERIQECEDQKDAEKNSTANVRKSITPLQRDVTGFMKAMQTPPEPFDPAEMNEQIRDKTRQIRDATDKADAIQQDVGSLGQQISQRSRIIDDAQREKEHMQSQAGQQMNKLQSFSRDAARAWDWVKNHRDRFQGDVFGPPLVECNVKDEKHASAVESLVQMSDALAFTVTTKADFDVLTDQFHAMKIRQVSVRAAYNGLDTFRPPMANDALQQYGLQGWLIELLEGPEPVLAMLCDNRNMHQTAYTLRDITSAQLSALQRSPISSWVTSKQSNTITRRREYGDKATSTKVQDLRPARIFTKASIDHQKFGDIDRRIAEAQSEIDELKESRVAKMDEGNAFKTHLAKLKSDKEAIEGDKKTKQTQHSSFNALPVKLENAERKLSEAKAQIASSSQRMAEIDRKQDGICLEKGQAALDYANSIEQLRLHHIRLIESEILAIEARSDLDQLEARHAKEQQQIAEHEHEVEDLKRRTKELHKEGQRLHDVCIEIRETLTDEELEILDSIDEWDLSQLETELASLSARLESLVGGGNENTIREYEARAKEIESKTRRLNELRTASDVLTSHIAGVREQWEPQLDELVAEISEAFADSFAKIQCAGEVGVYKDEDFEQWAIQIKVKFRENEPLSLLDSRRQSGGERAVSTIFYLMALQSLARAPFRVVDEINQGMDPRNERLVHSRMVDIACAEIREGRQGSQYFLITPKLLQGLKYHPDMKVHCIASGEHMPDDFREVDFATAAKRALELRGRQGVAAR